MRCRPPLAPLVAQAGHGSIAAGWKVEASAQPWREGRSLHDILGSEVAVVEDERSGGGSDGAGSSPIGRTVVWGAARLRVIECSCVAEDLLASLLRAGFGKSQ